MEQKKRGRKKGIERVGYLELAKMVADAGGLYQYETQAVLQILNCKLIELALNQEQEVQLTNFASMTHKVQKERTYTKFNEGVQITDPEYVKPKISINDTINYLSKYRRHFDRSETYVEREEDKETGKIVYKQIAVDLVFDASRPNLLDDLIVVSAELTGVYRLKIVYGNEEERAIIDRVLDAETLQQRYASAKEEVEKATPEKVDEWKRIVKGMESLYAIWNDHRLIVEPKATEGEG